MLDLIRGRRAVLVLVGLPALLVALALLDVIPGGWRLRTLFVSQQVQDQRRRATHRDERLAQFAAEPQPPPGGSLFIGSSTIERFPLRSLLAALKPINRGIGDEDLVGLEARALKTAARLEPRHVVLYAGSVNVRRPVTDGSWTSAEEIVERATSLSRRLLELPTVERVILVGILPERETGPRLRARIEAVNAGLADSGTPGIVFLPTAREPLIDPDGNLRSAFAADRLHLNTKGYLILAGWLTDLLERK